MNYPDLGFAKTKISGLNRGAQIGNEINPYVNDSRTRRKSDESTTMPVDRLMLGGTPTTSEEQSDDLAIHLL